MKWYDYVICAIAADMFSAAIVSFNPIVFVLAVMYWASYEHLRKTRVL